MKLKKNILLIIMSSLFILLLVLSCHNVFSPEKEIDIQSSDDNSLNRASRPCENACAQANGACHSNCGANGSCHDQCDRDYQNCLGYWTIQTRGTSICNIDSSTNYITLHFTLKCRTTDTQGFKGCDNNFWPDYGKRYSGRTLAERSFWLWQKGDAETWVNQQIARFGMGIGCP